jgi:hypothetical protein
MIDPNNMMQTWFNLMNEMMKGNSEARETVKSITGTSARPDEILRLMTRFMPQGVGPVPGEVLNESLEEYWRMMGVVPRYRYLELLERYEQLRLRMEELERANRQFQPMLNTSAQPEEARKVFDMWGSMLQETLKAQQEMMRSFTGQAADSSKQADEGTEKK